MFSIQTRIITSRQKVKSESDVDLKIESELEENTVSSAYIGLYFLHMWF